MLIPYDKNEKSLGTVELLRSYLLVCSPFICAIIIITTTTVVDGGGGFLLSFIMVEGFKYTLKDTSSTVHPRVKWRASTNIFCCLSIKGTKGADG